MNTNWLRLIACIAWGAVAVLPAAPANAKVLTTAFGSYATCSVSYYSGGRYDCYMDFPYTQTMRFIYEGCSSGGCGPSGSTYVEFVYPTGRKTVSGSTYCGSSGYMSYNLGSCAC